MSWFGPKLEPGERLILRRPEASGRLSMILGLLFALLNWLGSYLFIDWLSPNGIEAHGYILSLFLPIYVLRQVINGQKWNVAVTDRRLMVKRGWIWQAPLVVNLDEVENIVMDTAAYRIGIRAAGRQVTVHGGSFDLPEVMDAIERARGEAAA